MTDRGKLIGHLTSGCILPLLLVGLSPIKVVGIIDIGDRLWPEERGWYRGGSLPSCGPAQISSNQADSRRSWGNLLKARGSPRGYSAL